MRRKWIFVLSIFIFLGACASTEDAKRAPAAYDSGSNAHPAAYLVDRFPVNRPLPTRNKSNVEFYFKRCSMVGEDWPKSRTSYECDYP